MKFALQNAMQSVLAGWRNDLPAAWHPAVEQTELGFASIDAGLELEVWEPIFPARRGKVFPGAPKNAHMFHAFDGIAPVDVRCVILGQDPYPCPAFSTGRAFEAGNVAQWRELDKMFSVSVRVFMQQICAARTGDASYASAFSQWPRLLALPRFDLVGGYPPRCRRRLVSDCTACRQERSCPRYWHHRRLQRLAFAGGLELDF